jgi:fatty acid-binding protein DegV
MLDIATERLKSKTSIRLAVTHANAEVEALSLLETARGQLDAVETFTCPLSPVIGAHVGPGTPALNYMSGIA